MSEVSLLRNSLDLTKGCVKQGPYHDAIKWPNLRQYKCKAVHNLRPYFRQLPEKVLKGLPRILPLSLIGVDVLVLGGQAQLSGQDGGLVHEGVHLVQGDLEPE
jgi:hypothetical protein